LEASELLRDLLSAAELLQYMQGQRVLLAGQRVLLRLEAPGLLRDMLSDAGTDAGTDAGADAGANAGADAAELLRRMPGQRVLLAGQRVLLHLEASELLRDLLSAAELLQWVQGLRVLLAGQRVLLRLEEQRVLHGMLSGPDASPAELL